MPESFEERLEIPSEWIEIIEKLNPITAVVVWSILTNSLTPEIVQLAGFSPDVRKYASIAIVAGAGQQSMLDTSRTAYDELFEVFTDLLANPRTQIIQ